MVIYTETRSTVDYNKLMSLMVNTDYH